MFEDLVSNKNPLSCENGFKIYVSALSNFQPKSSVFQLHYHTLISTSTPEGSSNFIRASTVLEDEE